MIRKFLIGFFTIAIILYLISALIIGLYKDELISLYKDKINSSSDFKINYSRIELNPWRLFPSISIKVVDPTIVLSTKNNTKTVLNALHINSHISFFEAIKGNVKFTSLVISDGRMFLDDQILDLLFDNENNTQKKSAMQMNLDNVYIKNFSFAYESSFDFSFTVHFTKATLSGFYKDNAGTFNFMATSDSIFYNHKNIKPLTGLIKYNGNLNILGDTVMIPDGAILYRGVPIKATLYYNFKKDDFETSFSAKKVKLSKQQLLIGQLSDYKIPSGYLDIDFKYVTNFSKPDFNYIKSVFNLSQTKLRTEKKGSYNVEDLSGIFVFNSSLRKSNIILNNITISTDGGHFNGSLKINNLEKPICLLDGSFLFQENFTALFRAPFSAIVDGTIKTIVQFNNIDNFNTFKLLRIKSAFSVNNMIINGSRDFDQITGSFVVDDNDLKAIYSGQLNQSNVSGSMGVPNLLGYINYGQTPELNAILNADNLDIQFFIKNKILTSKSNSKSQPKIALSLRGDIKNLYSNDFLLSNTSFHVNYSNQIINILEFKFNVFDGSFNGSAVLSNSSNLILRSGFTNVDIKNFSSFLANNLKQIDLSNHISGFLDGNINLVCNIDSLISNKYGSLDLHSSLNINNGKIFNIKQFKKISLLTKLKEIEDIEFKTLSNNLYIRNNTLTLPEMEIQSNLLNIKVSGNHNFNGNYKYYLNLKLAELLGKNYKTLNSDIDYSTDEQNRVNLFIKITGTKDMFSVSYDTKRAFNGFKVNIFNDTKEIKKTLLEDFMGVNDSLKIVKNKNVDTLGNKPKKTPFNIEWEEFDTIKIK